MILVVSEYEEKKLSCIYFSA